jgi:hypothetical protein
MVDETATPEVVSKLESLGFGRAAAKVKEASVRKRKLAIAYEHYRYVRQENVDKFNAALKVKTAKVDRLEYQRLAFTSISDYPDVPPNDVLEAMSVAVGRQCFDTFEIAHIVQVKDPILFGRVTGCPDRFYVAQWDDDVKISDLLKDNEG